MTVQKATPSSIFLWGALEEAPATSQPNAPGVVVVSEGDGVVVLGISGLIAGDTAYLVNRVDITGETWSDQSETHKVTADGNFSWTGLSNGTRYEFSGYILRTSVYGPWAPPVKGTPEGGSVAADDNINVALRTMKGSAVYWEFSSTDAFGKPVYSTPVEIECRWEDVQEEFIDSDGTPQVSRAKLFVDRDMELQGVLLEGTLDDVDDVANPKDNDDAWEIRLFKKTPDFKGNKFLREVFL